MNGFATARQARDFHFIYTNPDYRHIIKEIDTGDAHWLDFNLTPHAQQELFARGVRAAREFLDKFNFQEYKDERRKLSEPPGFPPSPDPNPQDDT